MQHFARQSIGRERFFSVLNTVLPLIRMYRLEAASCLCQNVEDGNEDAAAPFLLVVSIYARSYS